MSIETKIKDRLKFYGLTEKDLTAKEMKQLRKELSSNSVSLDGVLDNPEIYYRKKK